MGSPLIEVGAPITHTLRIYALSWCVQLLSAGVLLTGALLKQDFPSLEVYKEARCCVGCTVALAKQALCLPNTQHLAMLLLLHIFSRQRKPQPSRYPLGAVPACSALPYGS